MGTDTLVHITFSELQRNDNGIPLYKDIIKNLQIDDSASMFTMRALHGIDGNNNVKINVMESTSLNNLPITIDVIGQNDRSSSISSQIPNGQMYVVTKEEEHDNKYSCHQLLKVYMEERFHWLKPENYQEIMKLCQRSRLIWTVAFLGIRNSFLPFKVPVMIETVGTTEEISQLITSIRAISPTCKMITIPVNVIANK